MGYDYDYDYYDNDDFIRKNFNRTLNQAGNKGYNANYASVNTNRNDNFLAKMNKCVSTIGTITTLAIMGYGLYKFYKHVYYPFKRQQEMRPYVDKTKENERVMKGTIVKNKFQPKIVRETIREWIDRKNDEKQKVCFYGGPKDDGSTTFVKQPDGVYVAPYDVERYMQNHPELYESNTTSS